MERKMYEPTDKQNQKWNGFKSIEMPTDDEFKTRWAKSHHRTTRGWGLGKRQWIVGNLSQLGLDYQTPLSDDDGENMNAYNLGYYRGYTEFSKLSREMGAAYPVFVEKYSN
jgi:hypothetical protein